MTELLWQSTLLVALAFFFGAVLACGLKRRYYYGTLDQDVHGRGSGRVACTECGPAEDRGCLARRP